MIGSLWQRRRKHAAPTVTVALTALLMASSANATPLFGMADASTVVVRGTVESTNPYPDIKLEVFRIKVTRALKGDVVAGETLALAQEMLFESTKPYFTPGVETLILAVPLPRYSSFVQVLPEGTYWRWTERLETAADVAVLTDPVLTDAVARYLSVRDDAEASADFLIAAVVGPSARLRNDALAAIGQRREIPPLLDAGRLQPLSGWLHDERQPVPERARVVVLLARAGAPGIVSLAEGLAATDGPLQAAAVDALVSMDRMPSITHLLAWSKSPDEALRLAASRGLAKTGSPPALDRLAEMLQHDASTNVRLAIVRALGSVPAERAVTLLASELANADQALVAAAAESLGDLHTSAAIAALGVALEKGSAEAQAAAAFALKRCNKHEAEEILHQQEASHPDPNVRRLCRLALGESMHEH